MYYWHNGNDWTFLYNIGTPLIDSMVNQSFLSIQPLLLIFILNLILRLSTFLCPCLFVSFLYHLMNTIFQCCMKTSNHFHLTRSTTIQLSLFCCLSSHSKHFFKKLEQKQGWIHGNLVVEGLAGAAMQKPLAIQKCYGLMDGWTDGRTDGWTDGRTNRPSRCRVVCPRLKRTRIVDVI